jgi:hypothetical protein
MFLIDEHGERPRRQLKSVPSMANCTVPVGVPPPEAGVTFAVKLTACPKFEGFWLETTAVVLAA